MDNTLYYFFSTLAQSFAALAAFVFVAAQSRIEWLDSKVTSTKMATLYLIHAGTQNIEFYMVTKSATEVANDAESRQNKELQILAKDLKGFISQIQLLRNSIQIHVIWGISMIILGLIGIAVTPLIKDCILLSWGVLIFCICIATFSSFRTGKFIIESLKVTLKKPI